MEKKIPPREVTCAFTGHRPETLPWGTNERDARCVLLKGALLQAVERVYDRGYRHFICGMARGADLYFCEAVLGCRAHHGDITLEAAIPYAEQAKLWPGEDQARYKELLALCDLETLVQVEYTQDVFLRRNVYMVEHASQMIAVFNGRWIRSGTAATVRYALNHDVPVDVVWPV